MSDTPIVARGVRTAELDDWHRTVAAAFGGFPQPELVELERRLLPLERTIGAFDGDRLVGGAASYPFDMTVPGGETIPVAAVTGVGVLGTHRRRGALRAMMSLQLDDVATRGDAAAVLNASESGIYGRFGYGLAQQFQQVRMRADRVRFDPPPPSRALELVPARDAAPRLAPIFDAYRVTRSGELSRPMDWWEGVLGDVESWKGGGKLFVVVADPHQGDPGGYLIYALQPTGDGPFKRMVVRELIAASAETEAALWRYCVELDLVEVVEAIVRPLDDPLRWRLDDPRELATVRQCDFLWVRLLDVPRALSSRTYGDEHDLVIDVADAMRPDVGDHYRLHASPKGGECERTDADADLSMTVADLGALYLGGTSATTLARAGRLRERRPGAIEEADAVFRVDRQPHCSTFF